MARLGGLAVRTAAGCRRTRAPPWADCMQIACCTPRTPHAHRMHMHMSHAHVHAHAHEMCMYQVRRLLRRGLALLLPAPLPSSQAARLRLLYRPARREAGLGKATRLGIRPRQM
eukprot:scaffold85695_cov69-Phaeocystis_antarctica.AAC.2